MLFDRKVLKLKPLSERINDLDKSCIQDIEEKRIIENQEVWKNVASRIVEAKANNASIILMMGAHVIRSGVQKYIIDLMKKGYISCLSFNGAGMIHDFELAFIGATTESVARYIKEGQFGLWKETGIINDIINKAYENNKNCGMGEALGENIYNGEYPYKDLSLFATAYKLKIPALVHIGIGYDIIHEHPNFDGAASGALSYNDFLSFATQVKNLENGVVMNYGSAIMAPEIYLKALSMARNVAKQEGEKIKNFTTLVCDLHEMKSDFSKEPEKATSEYYFRPHKTMLVRTVADGGTSYYIKGKHADTIPFLWTAINEEEQKNDRK